MAVQNVVSATLAEDTKREILEGIAAIKGKLDFLLTLRSAEVQALFKAGKEFAPFLDECHEVARQHPAIMPGIFDKDEFERDWKLAKDLGAISDALNQLSQGVDHTLTAARSDALMAALDIYAAVKLNRDRVPGLSLVAERLGSWFKRASPQAKAKQA